MRIANQTMTTNGVETTGANSSLLPRLLRHVCSLSGGTRLQLIAIRLVCRIEGGQMWSATYRELMSRHCQVEIGIHSYGQPLVPGFLPPGTRVGNYCSLADGMTIFRRNHPTDRISQHPFFYNAAVGILKEDSIGNVEDNPLTIGHDVWIGHGVIVTAGCRSIGDSAVVASGAVVTSDVAPFAIVGGVPSKLIRSRISSELIDIIRASQWWLMPYSELVQHHHFFLKPLTLETAREFHAACMAGKRGV